MSNGQESRTSSEIFQKGFLEPFLHSEERPFVKLLNWYTGFGKTYTAAVFAIDLFVNRDVIPVFIAPLQSLVAGFASDIQVHHRPDIYGDEIEAAIRSTGNSVPVYRLYSIDYHLNDRTFFAAALALVSWIHGSPQVVRDLDNLTGQSARKDDLTARLAELRAKSVICRESPYLGMSTSDDTYEDSQAAYLRAARRARSVADSLTADLIRIELAARERKEGSPGYLNEPAVADMVRRLHPLQAFLDKPGIIICTASKAQVSHSVFVYDKARLRCKPENFENLPAFLEELNRDGSELGRKVSRRADAARVVTFVDEEEDSYWYLFSQRKSVLNPDDRSDLSIVVSEFFTFFDLKWPFAFEPINGNHIDHQPQPSLSSDRGNRATSVRFHCVCIPGRMPGVEPSNSASGKSRRHGCAPSLQTMSTLPSCQRPPRHRVNRPE
ncbi:hypothetical protein [Cupriavidus consociatus]|uniref:hypothetical protein n=1 Tax=Cupriavidus consociatus TaxID=2821357 RepID=UPI001AE45F1D|nr:MULTISPECIES: hypothetical protein [unclassified Cupriavidus]MBP0625409.1 hypothetical protein [Cupriavidus sp. LEh25]MDK2662150.1 hypothetical protein [Cupriavidus sp. LEh21]